MDLLFEVLTLISSYLRTKELIEVSTVSKTYHLAVRKNKLFKSYLILGNCLTIKDLCLIIIVTLALVSPTICLCI